MYQKVHTQAVFHTHQRSENLCLKKKCKIAKLLREKSCISSGILQEVLELDRHSPLWTELCPSAKGAMLLYQTVKPDGETVFKPQRRTDKQH